ncbi:MAG: hypothetical protein MK212_07575 [Saprospiraceae bacterium]|nr:hypothetical protein [Saprospiraceae bacterium]
MILNNIQYTLAVIVVLFLSNDPICAQSIDDLKKNKDVVWVAEVFMDYTPRRGKYDVGVYAQRGTRLEPYDRAFPSIKGETSFKWLKFQIEDINQTQEMEQDIVFQMFNPKKLKYKAYRTDKLEDVYTKQELRSIVYPVDTIITFHPETFEEVIYITERSIDPLDIDVFRLKQLIYYDQNKHQIISIPIALAPLIRKMDPSGGNILTYPLFWIPVQTIGKSPNLSSPKITWAKRIYRTYPFDAIKTLKTDKHKKECIQDMIHYFRENAEKVQLAKDSYIHVDGITPMSKEEIKQLGSYVDTVVLFSSDNISEEQVIRQREFDLEDFEDIGLLQDWYWNAQEQKLYIRHTGFYLIEKQYDKNGKFLVDRPFFYRRVEFK